VEIVLTVKNAVSVKIASIVKLAITALTVKNAIIASIVKNVKIALIA
jgi:hypothetical protein